MHIVNQKFIDNDHVIHVLVVGAGGTGSQVMQGLARINTALRGLYKQGIHVTLIDDDTVSQANLGRQLFAPQDIGRAKSEVIVERINRFFGFDFHAIQDKFSAYANKINNTRLIISCTDTVKSRMEIDNAIHKERYSGYWIDCGNTRTTGQVILSNNEKNGKINNIFELFGEITEDIDTPSCSLAEALQKQDLFINTIVADYACQMVWKLFNNHILNMQGYYINLDTGTTKPILIK